MRPGWLVPLLLVVVCLGGLRSARAQEVVHRSLDQRSFLMSVGGGACLPRSGRFVAGSGNGGWNYGYLEANLELDLGPHLGAGSFGPAAPRLGASAFAAAAPCLGGGMLGGTVRVSQPWEERTGRWTAGLGPSIGSDGAVLAEADVSLEVRSRIGFALVLGPKLAVALNHAGGGPCGVDTCGVDVPPGSFLLLLRLGLGFNL
jgi:hypothetical protein